MSAFLEFGKRVGWADAPEYLLRSLPGHALRAGAVDTLLQNTDFVLHEDLRRLVPAADLVQETGTVEIAQLLRRTPRALAVGPSERLALLSVTEALDNIGTTFRKHVGADDPPYRGRWASVSGRA